MQKTHDLKLSDELRSEMERIILSQIASATEGVADRDANFAAWHDAVEQLSDTESQLRSRNGCDLVYPITYEAYKTTKDNLVQNLKRDPLVTVDPIHAEDEDDAETHERYMVSKAHEIDLRDYLREMVDYVCTFGTAVLYHGWASRETTERDFVSVDPNTGEEVLEGEENPETDYEEVPQTEKKIEEGIELRSIHPADFFLYPANALRLVGQAASVGCGERIYLTADELLAGIEDMGFDEDAVYDMLRRGSNGEVGPLRESDDESVGVKGSQGNAPFACFIWFTKPPLVWGGDTLATPKAILQDDLMVIACPETSTVLRMNFSPYAERPYVAYYMEKPAGRFWGRGIPQIVEGLQKEANAEIQMGIDISNIIATPAWKVKQKVSNRNENFELYPNAIYYVDDMDDIAPLVMPQQSSQPLAITQMADMKAKELTSAGGFGTLHQKQRKAAEIQSVQQQAFSKFSASADQFNISVVRTFQLIAALCAAHGDEEEDFVDEFAHAGKIKKSTLKRKYIYRGTMSEPGATPEDRLQIAELAGTVSEKYAQQEQALAGRPDILKRMWHSARGVLNSAGVHNPETYIGKEPEVPAGAASGQPQLAGFPTQPGVAGLPSPPPASGAGQPQ